MAYEPPPRPRLPIVYQDVMRVIVAGKPGDPRIGINRCAESDVPLVLSLDEARELAQALAWALNEYDEAMGRGSFYPRGVRRGGGTRPD